MTQLDDATRSRAEFQEIWNTHALQTRTLTLAATQTLVPSERELAADRNDLLPNLLSTQTQHSQLRVVGEIGRGGMGVVRLAEQVALDREVAIKQVHDDRHDDRHARELLLEGLLVGSLEHPNIVPVYLLGKDERGFPTLVMKRIEGTSWAEILRGSRGVPEGADPLEWHLEVLMDVCNAVHFAHSRRILHRDLKPDNVMVGSFGEVYVLDWGIAVTLDAAHPVFPRARDANYVAGTPAYMAPEMLHGDGSLLSERTDVYLLGGILHEVLTGDVPHHGDDMFELMYNAWRSEPCEYDGVPLELARICHRAMAHDPADRFASADELRRAIATFLRHRASVAISDEAKRAAARFEELTEASDLAADELFSVFQEAHFGFDAALAAWAENEDAQVGRERLLRRMLACELAVGNARGARRTLSLLGDSSEEVLAEVERLEAQAEAATQAAQELERARFDNDLSVQSKWRAVALVDVALVWTAVAVIAWHTERSYSHWWIVLSVSACAVVGTGFAIWKRDLFLANRVSRYLLGGYAMSVIFMCVVHLCVHFGQLDPRLAPMGDMLVFGATAVMVGFTFDMTVILVGLAYLVGAVIAAQNLDLGFWILTVCVVGSQLFLSAVDLLNVRRGPPPVSDFDPSCRFTRSAGGSSHRFRSSDD